MSKKNSNVIQLKDYTPPAFSIEKIDLTFELDPQKTLVNAVMFVRRSPDAECKDLVLDGEALTLINLELDDKKLTKKQFQTDDSQLTIFSVPDQFKLSITTQICPKENTRLEGLYTSSQMFCTQCEAHGFRRIMYYLDRPDVMATFTTKIIADQQQYPVLLSNGNKISVGHNKQGQHWVTWQDPFKKPCYLFALVAGQLLEVQDSFTTLSGRKVTLSIFVEPGNEDKCQHAMASLKRAMRWDEEVYGREYDLDIFMIVAVSDFNMGAMENKGLNIFNAKYILANPESATDTDYTLIENVVAHEYFHNWTGNRITCRDWFQLSLKEGLTVFRDQEFTRDMHSRDVNRIDDVSYLRQHQFKEDAGPMAHPVQPQSYIEVNNFYTATVYNKGAEVIRMMHTLLGAKRFRQGMDVYFDRHDGFAVTIEDFVKAMEDANKVDLQQFRLWYTVAGTPEITVKSMYSDSDRALTIEFKQTGPEIMHIPMKFALFSQQGEVLYEEECLDIKEPVQEFHIANVSEQPIISLLRDFSAPIKLNHEISPQQNAVLFKHDTDGFSRWQAGQDLGLSCLSMLVHQQQTGDTFFIPDQLLDVYGEIIEDRTSDQALCARLLMLPSEDSIAAMQSVIDVDAIHQARQWMVKQIATRFSNQLENCYWQNKGETDGERALKNQCLQYLVATGESSALELVQQQFNAARNMTEVMGAMSAVNDDPSPIREQLLTDFYQRWQDNELVLDKWFGIQARSNLPDTLHTVKKLTEHSAFTIKNPNKVRALLGSFAHLNPVAFHAADGQGYDFIANQVRILDGLNPQVAARLVSAFNAWQRYDKPRQKLMLGQLALLSEQTSSKDVQEIVDKSLNHNT